MRETKGLSVAGLFQKMNVDKGLSGAKFLCLKLIGKHQR